MAAVWTDPNGITRLVLAVMGGGEIGGYDCALVEIDAAGVDVLAARAVMAAAARERDPACQGIEYQDPGLEYRNWDYNSEEPSDAEGNPPPCWEPVSDGEGRTDCDRVFVTWEGGVRWSAYPKYCDQPVHLETDEITIDQLRRWIAEGKIDAGD